MKQLVIALGLTAVTFGLLAVEANAAGGPWQKWRQYVRSNPKAAAKPVPGGLFPSYSRYQSVDDAYPRYIGAFHSRYFNDLGIPPGDVGVRANTLYMLPW